MADGTLGADASAIEKYVWGPQILVTQDRVDAFASATGDDQWIHTDVERARQEISGTIVQGNLLASMVANLFPDVYILPSWASRMMNRRHSFELGSPVHTGLAIYGMITEIEVLADRKMMQIIRYVYQIAEVGNPKPAVKGEIEIVLMKK